MIYGEDFLLTTTLDYNHFHFQYMNSLLKDSCNFQLSFFKKIKVGKNSVDQKSFKINFQSDMLHVDTAQFIIVPSLSNLVGTLFHINVHKIVFVSLCTISDFQNTGLMWKKKKKIGVIDCSLYYAILFVKQLLWKYFSY